MISHLSAQNSVVNLEFESLDASKTWKRVFKDKGNKDWRKLWFLDGQLATISNTKKGMHFVAGPEDKNDAHHAVLWTKASFKGDLRIEFDYTKTDSAQKNVTILYIQATGIGSAPFYNDISKWNDLRKIPSMSTYFNNMNALHISYAAFTPEGEEYVRARRYPVTSDTTFKNTMIPPSYDDFEKLFQKGITYHITVLKAGEKLFFKVIGGDANKIFFWDLNGKAPIFEGRIGLRHMFTRSAIYKNFEIFTH